MYILELQKYITFPARHKDIQLINVLIGILYGNLKMSVPKLCDVCHMRKPVSVMHFVTTWFVEFKIVVFIVFKRLQHNVPKMFQLMYAQ